jgi:protein-L-isoaspartate(D-aspartate) O-methyltransferase
MTFIESLSAIIPYSKDLSLKYTNLEAVKFTLLGIVNSLLLAKESKVDYQTELLQEAKQKYHLSPQICEAYKALPRHEFLDRFSPDQVSWITVTPENLPLIYADTTLLLYQRQGFVSTISQPSFVLRMIDMLGLSPGMRVFELGTGSGWNAALIGHMVGENGKVISFEIIPEMAEQAIRHLKKFDLPQVEVIEGDALEGIWEMKEFDRGIFTAGAWDMPGILFDVMKVGGKLLFVLKTSRGDLLMLLERKKDHFKVLDTLPCRFVTVTGASQNIYHSNLSELYLTKGEITIWPQGSMGLGPNIISGRDMIFKIN